MENNELEKIYKNHKTLEYYFTYSTGGFDRIAYTDGRNYDDALKNFVNLTVQLGASVANCHSDNKTAVKIRVQGLKFPVYCVKYDGMYYICKGINKKDEQGIKIHWNIE